MGEEPGEVLSSHSCNGMRGLMRQGVTKGVVPCPINLQMMLHKWVMDVGGGWGLGVVVCRADEMLSTSHGCNGMQGMMG